MRRSPALSPYLTRQFPAGVATRAQLLALGISRATIARRCRPGGPWRTLLLGLVQLDSGRTTGPQRIRATFLHAGTGAMLTGISGARMHGVSKVPGDTRVHVLVSARRHVMSRDFALVTRSTRLPTSREIGGLPVAPLARCLVDAATRLDDVDAVRAMMADAVQMRLCSVEDLVEELSQPRRPGTALARRVLVEIADGIRSAAEAWARDLVLRSGLPAPKWNVELRDELGRSLGVVDAYWEEAGLAWEIQSRTFHLSPQALKRDVQKLAGLAAAGVTVFPSAATDLRDEPCEVLGELTSAYGRAASSPAPAVVAMLWRPGPDRSRASA